MKTSAFIAIAAVLSLSGGAALGQSLAQSLAQNIVQDSVSPSQAQVFPMPPPEPSAITAPSGVDMPARASAYSDRVTRCMQFGTSIGVPPDRMDDYIKRCQMQ
ncbi:MAG TPA: hypothetical protein VFC54_09325 [Pseudolabrys sp.]|nr:hypothetical protein [Pseudolabrys sp.]